VQSFTFTPSCAYVVWSSSIGKIRISGWRITVVYCKSANYSRKLTFQGKSQLNANGESILGSSTDLCLNATENWRPLLIQLYTHTHMHGYIYTPN
jgi:hypothetical protein